MPQPLQALTHRLKNHADQRGPTSRFDSSKGRGPFKTEIGVGKVIKGTSHLEESPQDHFVD